MKILFATVDDPLDPRAWSGTTSRIAKVLAFVADEFVCVGSLRKESSRRRLWPTVELPDRSKAICHHYAAKVNRAVDLEQPDLVFSNSTLPVALLHCSVPVVTWLDGTFASLAGYYPEFDGLSRRQLALGNLLDRRALEKNCVSLFSSEWAAAGAVESYGISREDVAVVPFGANYPLGKSPREGNARLISCRSRRDAIRLVTIGVNWVRKGFQKALEFRAALEAHCSRPVCLTIAGLEAEAADCDLGSLKGRVTLTGFLDKFTDEGWFKYSELLRKSHWNVLFPMADCTPIVVNEAMGFGLPTIAHHTGGISDMIEDGVNGVLQDADEPLDRLAARVAHVVDSNHAYVDLVRSTLDRYAERHSWEAAAESVSQILSTISIGR